MKVRTPCWMCSPSRSTEYSSLSVRRQYGLYESVCPICENEGYVSYDTLEPVVDWTGAKNYLDFLDSIKIEKTDKPATETALNRYCEYLKEEITRILATPLDQVEEEDLYRAKAFSEVLVDLVKILNTEKD